MLKLLTCSRGHFWESDDASVCPECGAAAEPLPHLDLTPVPPLAPAAPKEPPPLAAKGLPNIEGYELLEDLGPGPCGFRLYRARQLLVNREVVIEVVLAREDPKQRSWS